MPASFVEVIDCLVDLVLRFEGPYKKAAEEGEVTDSFLAHHVERIWLLQ